MSKVRTAALQLNFVEGEDREGRVDRVLMSLRETPASDLLVLPELWDVGYFAFDRYPIDARSLEEGPLPALQEVARNKRCVIVAGSVLERNGELLHNTVVVVGRDGRLLGLYRKKHLFGYGSKESELLTPGNEVVVCETDFGRIGLATCFDLRFPDQFAEMRRKGVDLFVVPSAWPMARLDHWQILTRARAIETQTPLVACNSSGVNESVELGGHSLIASARGDVLASRESGHAWITTEIDTADTESWRREFPMRDEAFSL